MRAIRHPGFRLGQEVDRRLEQFLARCVSRRNQNEKSEKKSALQGLSWAEPGYTRTRSLQVGPMLSDRPFDTGKTDRRNIKLSTSKKSLETLFFVDCIGLSLSPSEGPVFVALPRKPLMPQEITKKSDTQVLSKKSDTQVLEEFLIRF